MEQLLSNRQGPEWTSGVRLGLTWDRRPWPGLSSGLPHNTTSTITKTQRICIMGPTLMPGRLEQLCQHDKQASKNISNINLSFTSLIGLMVGSGNNGNNEISTTFSSNKVSHGLEDSLKDIGHVLLLV